jgi:uncharacterized protein YndB with AHSA1/START domain
MDASVAGPGGRPAAYADRVRNSGASVSRLIDLPRVIVWDAFVDPELVSGWFDGDAPLAAEGELRELREPELLVIDSAASGALEITLEEVPEGTRGTSTLVTVELPEVADHATSLRAVACWGARLDQLAGLLRGHPVDWPNWERDHGDDFRERLRALGGDPR